MSHFSYIKVQIKNPNIDILKMSIQELAKDINGEVVGEIVDWYGNVRSDFIIGIRNKVFQRGVGIKINRNGEVELVGDFYLIEHHVNDLLEKIVMYYTKNATAYALSQMGYNVQQSKSEDKILLYAYQM